MPQLTPGARLREHQTRADTKFGAPDYLIPRQSGSTSRVSPPRQRPEHNPNPDGTDFGLLGPMGCSMSSLNHGDCGETSKSNLTRLRAEPLGTNPSLATASSSPAIC